MPTPEEFKENMEDMQTKHASDIEAVHVIMDNLMCKVLVELGYKEGVDIFNDTEKGYY